MLGFVKKKDPLCGMREEKGKGVKKEGKWFCSENCLEEYGKGKQGRPASRSCCQ